MTVQNGCSKCLFVVCVALVDLEPAQLLLFVQSFGIPVVSMSRLLHCLDSAVELDAEAMEGAVVDKGYMAQLIEVQRMRGATGGTQFYQLLLEGHSAPSQTGTTSPYLSFALTLVFYISSAVWLGW